MTIFFICNLAVLCFAAAFEKHNETYYSESKIGKENCESEK